MPATDPARPDLLTDLAEALFDHGDIHAALERADEAIRAAESLGDEPAAMRARLRRLAVQAMADPEFRGSEIIPELERMIESLEQLGDAPTLTLAWGFLGRLRFFAGHARDAEACYARAVEYAKRAGKPHYENAVRMWWAGAKRHGAAPADEAAAFIEELTDLTSRSVGLEAYRLALTAAMHAFAGRFDDARSAMSAAEQIELELGLEIRHFANATEAGTIEILAGNTERAVEMMRIGYEGLGRLGEMGFRSTCGTTLAEALVDLGRDAEAEPILRECEEMAQAEDFDPQARLRATRARILARRGELEEAERLAREAVEIMARTDYIDETGSTLVALADVLEAAGRRDEAAEVLREALGLFERKGNLVLAGRTRDRLDALRADATA